MHAGVTACLQSGVYSRRLSTAPELCLQTTRFEPETLQSLAGKWKPSTQYLHTTRRGMSPRHLKIMKKDYMDLHREQIPVSCNLQHKQTCRWTILPSDIKKTVVIRIFQLLLIIKRTVEINLNI